MILSRHFFDVDYTEEPSVLEDRQALRSLPKKKATGSDNTTMEIFQDSADSVKALRKLCQQTRKKAQWPAEWKRSVYRPISKEGDKKECANYRTISLISHASIITLKISQRRLESYIKRELPDRKSTRLNSSNIQTPRMPLFP